MVETLNKTENYRSYIRGVLRMYVFMDAGAFDSDEADALREQMVEPWYALSEEERKRMSAATASTSLCLSACDTTSHLIERIAY